MKKVLILHGRWWDDQENWFPWLKNELESKGFQVFVPALPSTNNPNLTEQLDYISDYYNNVWKIDYIVGHSLGCKLALHLIEKFNITNIKGILVAPTYRWLTDELWKKVYWTAYDNLKEYINKEIEFKKLWNRHTIFLSNNDPYIKVENAKNYYSNLENIKYIDFLNMWHFNEWAGIYKLPEILDYIT